MFKEMHAQGPLAALCVLPGIALQRPLDTSERNHNEMESQGGEGKPGTNNLHLVPSVQWALSSERLEIEK